MVIPKDSCHEGYPGLVFCALQLFPFKIAVRKLLFREGTFNI